MGLKKGYGNLLYSSSVTGSHHSLRVPSPGTSTARWMNQLSASAPCQCLTPAGIWTTSPARSARAGCPSSWYHPRPPVHSRICPPPLEAWWMCQLLRQPGAKVTLPMATPWRAYSDSSVPQNTGQRQYSHRRVQKLCE